MDTISSTLKQNRLGRKPSTFETLARETKKAAGIPSLYSLDIHEEDNNLLANSIVKEVNIRPAMW
jgi:hypothetical protein